ncbi:DUF1007 family protein [Rhodospirillum rubrum]|uniref:DUF1007 family protein n=1 Tax=Rhodospirillum rubrum (strain ATCC 11170 / ATH 1.1.1 / DSM 467 / LMG 4362 / NCIMB 8255 / S1) TaxID=269796 RepID=Q2RTJ1_RHORT|nr:DUF1007 family protein [Rhodospirillum rubrum]ABC22554.1 conserved hypothetical protein [Rhodospirillum rubrum ATCC 11170]AEO48272.1 hypothetical protein F11_09030 [Rhodospirillum rubrum F11]MBK5954143.1 hypothetical protein [Rhodospirillum rubrum]QXG82181.1 DUF1007 family protein [Rhodospirillum rubrum]HAP98626.1 DUF1007 domain-containing protein [Rhodospirillum rubrum]
MVRLLSVVLFLILCGTLPARAHPHVSIDARVALGVDGEGRLETVALTWIFDEIYSAYSVEGYKRDKAGHPDPAALEAMIAQAMIDLRDWDYFTELKIGGQRQTWGEVRAHEAKWEAGRLIYRFTLALAAPTSLRAVAPTLSLRVYDPSYYIAILLEDKPGAAQITPALPPCVVHIRPPMGLREAMIDDAVALAETIEPGQEGLGAPFAETIGVVCQ